ncbi:Flagellar hook-associated protein 1 [Sporomusa ovata DSM 2662]|uniref:Flagellar hook-associated protein 1 n=1 Tax=Sporomusa ovata TaxID=2378 RepID=A0A0U1KSQ6_9FIRM|nr:flagellar hook-associated protein FlgK [Sporomusa ovata]EQB26378.1 flagellar hook-associated protein 1 [Sporomusa ovata DSM 2662]CQR70458.1 Flagellar hook-associated protein FlgK [Sporomusa ovata]
MRPTFAGLNTVVQGLAAQKMSLDTVGHNVANANTPGYSRQRVNLVTTSPQTIYTGAGTAQIGTGVLTQSITRIRNTFIDQQIWKESSTLGYGQTMVDNLGKIEGVFQEPTENGMQSVLDKFWKAWNTLSTNGSDNGARTALRERGVEVVDTIQQANTQLRNMVADTNDVIGMRVDTINQITSEMLSLNKQIVTVEMGGQDHANDLRDRRDYLVDQLSSMINIQVTEGKNGSYTVQSSGCTLVNGSDTTKLTTKLNQDPDYGYGVVSVIAADSKVEMNFTSGEVKGLIDSRESAKDYLNNLSTMSQFLLQEFNAVHRDGYGLNGETNTNFFGAKSQDYNNNDPANYLTIFGTSTPKAKDWINQLTVNQALLDSTNGLSHIAAKTLVGSLTVTQSDPAAPKISIGGSYPTPAAPPTTTNPTLPAVYQVIVNKDASGVVTVGYRTSSDGGTTWLPASPAVTAATADAVSASKTQKFNLNGLTITLDTNYNYGTDSTYTFTTLKEAQGNAAGDNAVNLANRLKVDTSSNLGNSSLDTYYGSMIGALGVQTDNAKRLTTNQQTLVNQITNWRSSVSGVNLDEELSDMIRFQKGYNSAARILTAMDEMLDKLINSTGVVGR